MERAYSEDLQKEISAKEAVFKAKKEYYQTHTIFIVLIAM